MNPKIVKQLWALWDHTPPDDHIARSILKVDFHFSDSAAAEFLAVYRENLTFVKGASSDGASPDKDPPKGNSEDEKRRKHINVKVGDFVQWTSDGQVMFKPGRRVEWVSEDNSHLRVFGSPTGIPVNEVEVVPAPQAAPTAPAKASPSIQAGGPDDGELSVFLTGGRLQITADVGLEGIERLKKVLSKYEEILQLLSPAGSAN